jgi:hypothetical protein
MNAGHDASGNPRRAYVVLFDDGTHAYFAEGFAGIAALPSDYAPRAITPVPTTVAALRRFARTAQNAK